MTRSRDGLSPTPHSIEQARQVADLLEGGHSNKAIASVLGVSAPRVSQIRSALPRLAPYLGDPGPTQRLRSHREQLWEIRRQALTLAAKVRRDLRELDEELDAAEVDRLLGLRR